MGPDKAEEHQSMKNLHKNVKQLIGTSKLLSINQLNDIGNIGKMI